LQDDQFGYGSIHYEVQPPKSWLAIPTLKQLDGLRAEIQVRTSSQHIWAAASHILQYKRETHVPIPLRRAINRAAAFLETVDLEFERVLIERQEYTKLISKGVNDLPLNVESMRRVLDAALPAENRDDEEEEEDYAGLIDDLLHFKVTTTKQLESLIKKHLKAVLIEEKQHLLQLKEELVSGLGPLGTDEARIAKGVYFTHAGLVRMILKEEFGNKEVQDYLLGKAPN
jgi:putative GTP pyrophosphokinase